MKTRIKSNSTVILSSMIKRGWTHKDVTSLAGIDKFLLSRITRADKGISARTAAKLVSVFGDAAVTIFE